MDIEAIKGISQTEVARLHAEHGYNELPNREKKTLAAIILEIVREPMIMLLLAVVIVYFWLGDKTEAIVLAVSVVVITIIELYQNNKTEKALDSLRTMASPSCKVIRDGTHQTIPSHEVVVGDMIVISEGERVPADGRLVVAENVQADESLLTGESVAVEKDEAKTGKACQVFSGSMIVKGHGIAEVTAIGVATEIGKIGASLSTITDEKTLLKRETDNLVRKLAIFAIAASMLVTLVYWLQHGDLLNGFLAGLTLAISILPEEFPVVLAVFMALGAWRLAKSNVLARKSQTIETLGSASVLCTDKTGTLTTNHMTIELVYGEDGQPIDATSSSYNEIIRYGVLASQKKPFDPMEEAFIEAAGKALESIYGSNKLVKEYPLEEGAFSIVHVWEDANGKQQEVGLKGAPEHVFQLCKLSSGQQDSLQGTVKELATQGLRVLGVAKGQPRSDYPDDRSGYKYEFLGLVALGDPIRPEAAAAAKLCREAGIRVIMITGDYAETARRIATDVGIDHENVLTGNDFVALSETERKTALQKTSVFSRVLPTQKLTIVETLKAMGEVVAMTGDGVNDAPALKSAHIGIAMGKRGTDVAREAASIVLLDDNFASIVQGVRVGRRIFANLHKAMLYLLVVHIPIAIMSLVPVLLGWPLVLLPIHIVFLEFVIDSSSTLVFEGESEEPDTMKHPPRPLGSHLLNVAMIRQVILFGTATSFSVLAIYAYTLMVMGWSDEKARAISFLMIVVLNLLMIIVISGFRVVRESLSFKKLSPLLFVLMLATIALIMIYSLPVLMSLFKFAALTLAEILIAITVCVVVAMILMPIRVVLRKV